MQRQWHIATREMLTQPRFAASNRTIPIDRSRPVGCTGFPGMSPHSKRSRPDDGDAFVPDPQGRPGPLPSDDAESFAEEFIATATSAEQVDMDAQDEFVEEEVGGPFVAVEGDLEMDGDLELDTEIEIEVALAETAAKEEAGEEATRAGGGDEGAPPDRPAAVRR